MMVHWGDRLRTFYNDAYDASLGRKHPGHLGEPAFDWWSEMWDQLEPFFTKVLAGESFYTEDARYTPDRDGAAREAYFTHCHSPIWDDEGRVRGIFLVVTETTRLVLAEQGRVREERRNRQILDSARAWPPAGTRGPARCSAGGKRRCSASPRTAARARKGA
ncbi:PAS domain-containing protein [Paracidovorax cattleyae]|uniref:PAS fold-containing protein n=1 Tax=Paracidovorax cattleyae TaxID=80868 RepID=A0A1H0WJT7_9BURK|nr:PAS domain-containing protein [Paracidovorax cattleyae]SDP90831.1 PAS fold-containing protein [Paracidovorax cattleyae]